MMIEHDYTVAIPYRPTPSRAPLFDALAKWYEKNMGVDVKPIDAPIINHAKYDQTRFFNTAAARNKCVRDSPTEIVVINDADTIPDLQALHEGLEYVKSTGLACIPYTRYNQVSIDDTIDYLQGEPINKNRCSIYAGAVGGIVITTKSTWDRHNGQDERMFGWGYQDTAWHLSYDTLIGTINRTDGDIYALAHDLAPREQNMENNVYHFQKYLNARNDFEMMSDLVAGNRLVID